MSLSWSWLIAEGLICREVLHSVSKPFRLPMLPTRVLKRVMIFMVWALVASELDWDHFCFTWVLGQLLMLAVLIITNLGWTQSDLEELNSTSCSQSSGAKDYKLTCPHQWKTCSLINPYVYRLPADYDLQRAASNVLVSVIWGQYFKTEKNTIDPKELVPLLLYWINE